MKMPGFFAERSLLKKVYFNYMGNFEKNSSNLVVPALPTEKICNYWFNKCEEGNDSFCIRYDRWCPAPPDPIQTPPSGVCLYSCSMTSNSLSQYLDCIKAC